MRGTDSSVDLPSTSANSYASSLGSNPSVVVNRVTPLRSEYFILHHVASLTGEYNNDYKMQEENILMKSHGKVLLDYDKITGLVKGGITLLKLNWLVIECEYSYELHIITYNYFLPIPLIH